MSAAFTLDNRTPFAAESFVVADGHGGELVLVVVKATFVQARDGTIAIAEDQADIRYVDEYRGEPGSSSPRGDSDLAPYKPRVDVLVEACAWAPGGRAVEELVVAVRIGGLSKTLLVSGDRSWRAGLPSRPQPFVSMPIVWERAYGGTSEGRAVEPRNPVGVGVLGTAAVPNIELPDDRIRHPLQRGTPAGLGPIGRSWQPRAAMVGTCDERWKARRWPLLPEDFDPHFYQSAPPDQQLETLVGNEDVTLINLCPEGRWQMRLPTLDVPVHLIHVDGIERVELRTDTVELLPEHREVILTSRVAIPVVRGRGRLAEIVLGHVLPGWLRARAERKSHIDHRGADGSDIGRPCFHP